MMIPIITATGIPILETQWKNSWIPDNADVTESDCRDYYDEHEDAYTYDTGVTVIYAELPYNSGV